MIEIKILTSQQMNIGAHKGKIMVLGEIDIPPTMKDYEEFKTKYLGAKITSAGKKYIIKGIERPWTFIPGSGKEMGFLLEEIKNNKA